ELNDSTKLSGTILNNAAALARRARRSRVILHDPPMQKGALKAPFCYAQNSTIRQNCREQF
ncbi:hypothetical protein, partial [Klebsiella pneumoniae]|uniref:hypothetical protein n=1 Tax=Klebsiella pneumoniae TaxID=573 RepID=UPI001C9D1FBD